MERKYWVPGLERAHAVLQAVVKSPSKLRLTDLTNETGINKSTMFSLLHTMESLDWLKRESNDTYAIGTAFGWLGNAYFSGFSLADQFKEWADETASRLGETVQMAILDRGEIVYIAKKEATSPVRLVSEPGMRMPAHATAMGKLLLSQYPDDIVRELLQDRAMVKLTPNTLVSVERLVEQLAEIRRTGISFDLEEAVLGICCTAAPVFDRDGKITAAVSVSMLTRNWERKKSEACEQIQKLGKKLSFDHRI
ncbi:IclR family transcriptional regulator [Cohnella yongneupensis]|uniref:IclR family transcriptional regulator n=1 Tax=Cohnella yongneupensis TaxID=425006 RepID=A0ABW0R0E5_9BACL